MDRFAPLPNPPRLSVSELGPAEQLVVWSARELAGPGGCPLIVAREFRISLGEGPGAEVAYQSLARLLEHLATHGRRPFRPQPITCATVSHPERALIALVAAHQAGDEARAAALLEWLLPPHAAPAAAKHARRLGEKFARAGRRLHQRRVSRPPRPGPAARLSAAAARPAWLM